MSTIDSLLTHFIGIYQAYQPCLNTMDPDKARTLRPLDTESTNKNLFPKTNSPITGGATQRTSSIPYKRTVKSENTEKPGNMDILDCKSVIVKTKSDSLSLSPKTKKSDAEKSPSDKSHTDKQIPQIPYEKSNFELLTFNQLPQWAQDNEYIKKYYRKPNTNWKHVIISSFLQFHNESYNIYSHFLGATLAVLTAVHFMFLSSEEFSSGFLEKIVWIGYLLCATIMLTCSWTFHASYCRSYSTFCLTSKLDYAGISFMIVGSFTPWLFYTFYCEKLLFRIYFSCIAVLGIFCIIFSLAKKFAQPEYRSVRAGLFVGMGLFAVIPVIHMSFKVGFMVLFVDFHLWTLLMMAVCYIGGAAIFAMRFPERFFPGKFDRFMSSHNIFHTLIVVAAGVHFMGLFWLKQDRLEMGSTCE